MTLERSTAVRRVEPLAIDWKCVTWNGARFDTARRLHTPEVTGTIRVPQYLILATLEGGAQRLEVQSDCGHHFRGPEYAGVISIVPPHCERRLRMVGVEARWASLAIDETRFHQIVGEEHTGTSHCISNIRDDFLFALLGELTRTHARDGQLDPTYFDAMTTAAAHHLQHRHLNERRSSVESRLRLTRWQMKQVEAYIEAHLGTVIRVADLAALIGYSEGHFHRAFRATAHLTPIEFINHRRIQRAITLLRQQPESSVADVALQVGFVSVNHFTRVFRRLVGTTPARYRKPEALRALPET